MKWTNIWIKRPELRCVKEYVNWKWSIISVQREIPSTIIVFREKCFWTTLRKEGARVKKKHISAQHTKIITVVSMELSFAWKKRVRTEKPTTHSNIITGIARKSPGSGHLKWYSEKSTAKALATAIIMKTTAKQSKKTLKIRHWAHK